MADELEWAIGRGTHRPLDIREKVMPWCGITSGKYRAMRNGNYGIQGCLGILVSATYRRHPCPIGANPTSRPTEHLVLNQWLTSTHLGVAARSVSRADSAIGTKM
jgi:hypothetical protein